MARKPDPTGICVAAVTGAFGVRGEVRIKSFCAIPEAVADYGPLTTRDGRRSFTLTLVRPVAGGFAVRLSGVGDRDAADALKGEQLFAPRDKLPGLPDDEFYHADLIGLAVYDTGGVLLGVVRAVLDHGAGDLLEIAPDGGGETVLLPFTLDVVPTVDLAQGRIVADPPEGLLE